MMDFLTQLGTVTCLSFDTEQHMHEIHVKTKEPNLMIWSLESEGHDNIRSSKVLQSRVIVLAEHETQLLGW